MKNCTVCIIILITLLSSVCFSEGARYLIITPDNYYEAILSLAEWKTKKGMKAKVAKLSETGSYAYQIRAYVTNAYNTWNPRPEYLLLVGDHSTINIPYHDGANSDNYYTDISGNLYNEIIPGRFPASNVTEVNTMVSKTLGYERYPFMDDTLWFRKGMVIIREDYDPPDDSIYWDDSYFAINHMLDCEYVVIDTFSMIQGDYANDISNGINDGRTYIQFRGSTQYIWIDPFNINPYYVNNGFKLPVVMSATCNTTIGYWPTIGEDFLRAGTAESPKGAVGFIGTTTAGMGWAHFRSALTKGFVEGMFRNSSIFGLACEQGRKRMYHLYNSTFHYNSIECYGDPELNLWTYTPESLLVSYPEIVNLETSEVTVNVSNNDDLTPVSNALVCLMMDTTIYFYEYTNQQGNVTLSILPQNLGNMNITVTSRNYIPFEGLIPVISAGPYMTYQAYSLTDTLYGNRDGIINPGEIVSLKVLLKNIGNQTADGVNATISESSEFITVLDSTSPFNDIVPESTAWNLEDFTFQVSSNCTSNYSFDILLNIFDSEENSWQVSIPHLLVETCKLIVDTSVVYDTLVGDNGNSRLDPGETVHIDVSMKNIGQSILYSAECIIKCESDYILIFDSLLFFDEILPDSSVLSSNHIGLIVSPLTVPGYDVPFVIYTTENCSTYTHVDTISFTIEVGDIISSLPTGPDEYGYYCYDDTDTLYGSAPVYDWFEIAPPGPGSIVSLITNEDAKTTTLSLHFLTKYYGNNFNIISICSNGFLAPGYTNYKYGDNCAIPDTHGPANMVAPFWFDLDPSQYGDIYEYYDETNHRWICEFKDCAHYEATGLRETFQVIFLDPDYFPTPTGDGEIIYQYENVANISTATIGIENSSQDDGMQYYYNYNYDPTAAPIQNGRALKFTTHPPEPSQTPWILFNDYVIVDTSGNNDSIPNPGEDFEMYIYLENLGNITASSLSTTLSILDSLITTEDSVSSFGDIPVGYIACNVSDPYHLTISSEYDDSIARFYIHIESNDSDYVTVIPLTIKIGPPTGVLDEEGHYVFKLEQNYPNPMNSKTHIRFQIPLESKVMIEIYNLAGMHVKTLIDRKMKPGVYTLEWKGRDDNGNLLPVGVYFYRIDTGVNKKTRKLIKIM